VVVFGSGYSNQKPRSVKSQHFERYATYRWRSLTAFSVPLLPLLLPMIGLLVMRKQLTFDIEILITLPDGEGCVRSEEFMAEDLGQEDIIGNVLGFELVATDGAVG